MAISSLTKMTVPLASDQSSSTQGILMPKLGYRFRVTFENFGVSTPRTELTKQVVSCTRPSVDFAPIVIPVYNSRVKIAGRPTWQAINVVFRDDISGAVSKLVGEQLQKQFDFMEQSSAASGTDYKFKTIIEMLDGGNGASTPIVLEKWEVYGCYLENANYNSLSYSTNDAATVTLSIRYDNAIQFGNGGTDTVGVGQPAGIQLRDTDQTTG